MSYTPAGNILTTACDINVRHFTACLMSL